VVPAALFTAAVQAPDAFPARFARLRPRMRAALVVHRLYQRWCRAHEDEDAAAAPRPDRALTEAELLRGPAGGEDDDDIDLPRPKRARADTPSAHKGIIGSPDRSPAGGTEGKHITSLCITRIYFS
jgi:hypothetical protein